MIQKLEGYSLLELMVVIAVMSIIATMSIPSYHQSIIRTQVGEAINMAESLRGDIENYRRVHKHFPTNNVAAGIPASKNLIGNFVSKIELSEGALHISFGNYANKLIEGKTLSLRPFVVDGSPNSPLSWGCGLREAPTGMTAKGENRTSLDREFLPFQCF